MNGKIINNIYIVLLLILFQTGFGIEDTKVKVEKTHGGQNKMADIQNQIIMLEAQITQCKAEIYINDIPVIYLDSKITDKVSLSVNQLILDGNNQLMVVVNPGPTPSTSRTAGRSMPTAGMSVNVKLSRYPENAFPGDPSGVKLSEIKWNGDEKKSAEMPLELNTQWDAGNWRGPWAWTKAAKLQLDESTRKQAMEIIKNLHSSLDNADPEVLLGLEKIKLEEVNKAFNIDPSTEPNETRNWLQEEFKKGNWKMKPLSLGEIDLRLCADGRMIDCIAKDWEPILRSGNKDSQLLFDMKLAKINNQFYIVR